MHVQTRSQTQQHKHTLPSNSENMVEEEKNRHVIYETEKLIKKSLARQWTKFVPVQQDSHMIHFEIWGILDTTSL